MPSDCSDDARGAPGADEPTDLVSRLDFRLEQALRELPGAHRGGFVSSELAAVEAALRAVLEQDLARGQVFCEWGSGLGAVCALAASLSFEAHGIEIQGELVDAARILLAELQLDATFAHGSFLLPGDEDLLAGCGHTDSAVTTDAYRQLDLDPGGCDVVFAYPWPGEEDMHDRVFARHATPGALLLTYHDGSRVLVQRRTEDADELQSLGWMGGEAG